MPPDVIIGSLLSAIRNTLNGDDSCRRLSSFSRVTEKTSKGPQKSSTSTSLNKRMPTTFCLSIRVLLRKEFLGCRTGAGTETRPYRGFHCSDSASSAMNDSLEIIGAGSSGGPAVRRHRATAAPKRQFSLWERHQFCHQ